MNAGCVFVYVSEIMEQRAYDLGYPVVYRLLSDEPSTVLKSGMCIVVDPLRCDTNAKKAVAIAHELGHILAAAFAFFIEAAAWRWAVLNLLPRLKLQIVLYKHGGRVWEAADELDLPQDFVERAMALYFTN